MQKLKFAVLLAVMAAFGAAAAHAADRVQVCHIPPDDPLNFHTILLGEHALTPHLAHGDMAGSCSAACDALCDDGNACTQDYVGDCETSGCLAQPEPVDCSDSLLCTSDTCSPTDGCQYAPIACDDGDNCTVDTCNPADGQCTATPKNCGTAGQCDVATGDCEYPCEGITCDPVDQCHDPGQCVLPGVCIAGAPVADGTPCDDGDVYTIDDECNAGVCSGEAICPCDFSPEQLSCVLAGGNPTCYQTVPEGTPSSRSLIVFHQQSSPNACYLGADGLPFTDYGSGDFPLVLIENVPVWNVPVSSDPADWPVCIADSYFHPLAEGWKIRLTPEQANACFDQLSDYLSTNGIPCAIANQP